jgi:carboxyl-terminal processing protease
MQNQRYVLHILLIAVFIVALTVALKIGQSDDADRMAGRPTIQRQIKMLVEVIQMTRENYYQEVDVKKMMEGAIKGALASLGDPYTFYQSPEDQKRERENLFEARFGGIGIRIYEDKGFIKIAMPLPNTPAFRAGLQAGDIILKVDGKPATLGAETGLNIYDVVDMLRGKPNTPVTVTIKRRGRAEPFDVTLIREVIDIESIRYTMLPDNIGYIWVMSFTGKTEQEFTKALTELKEQGLKALILDLRWNSGGLLSTAKAIADAFLSEGVIVSTKGRRKEFNNTFMADEKTLVPNDMDLVVLVNEISASGSEIVAGAIKDNKRGVLLGTKTFGKGVVQERFPLRYGGAVSITISSYYTPSGVCIDKQGIEPNIIVEVKKPDDVESAMKEKMYKTGILDEFVISYIESFEKQNGKTPKDFKPLEAKLPELMRKLKAQGIDLDEKIVRIEARRVFDMNVGISRIPDLDTDEQLKKAIEVIKSGMVAQALSSEKPIKL